MAQENLESSEGDLLRQEDIERIVQECGVKEDDTTFYLEYTDEKGVPRVIHWMKKFRKFPTEEGLKDIKEVILAEKARLGL